MNELIFNLKKSKVLRKLNLSENPEERGRQQFHRMSNTSKMFSQIVEWNVKLIKFWKCSMGLYTNRINAVNPGKQSYVILPCNKSKTKEKFHFTHRVRQEVGFWPPLAFEMTSSSLAARSVPQLLLLPTSTLLVWI